MLCGLAIKKEVDWKLFKNYSTLLEKEKSFMKTFELIVLSQNNDVGKTEFFKIYYKYLLKYNLKI